MTAVVTVPTLAVLSMVVAHLLWTRSANLIDPGA